MRALILVLLLGCDGELRFEGPVRDGAIPDAPRVECDRDEQCTREGARRCDVAAHICVECGTSADCEDNEVCIERRCMRTCGETSNCSSDTPFCDPRGVCVCTATSCASSDRRICDPTGRCVECVNDAQCPSEEPRCDLVRGRCQP